MIPLEPKVFDVLRYLVQHSDRVATRQELLSALWPNEVVTEAVLPTNINVLRKALGQKKGDRTPIETVHGRGYRFSVPVVVMGPSTVHPAETRAPTSTRPGESARSLPAVVTVNPVDPSFAGRSQLLERLLANMRAAQERHGNVCLLTGEAGIGKTRLSSHVAEVARAAGADVWLGVCPEGMGTPMLWIWQQMLRCALVSEGPATLREWLGTSAGDVVQWLPALSDPRDTMPVDGPEHATFRMLDALQRILSHASASRMRVLVLEDMHRADQASWNLLRLLAPQLEQLSVWVVATLRGRDDLTVYEPVQKHVAELSRIPGCHSFFVRGLSEAESADLLVRVLGFPLSDQQVKKLHARSDGNPLFLRELAECLDANGQIDGQAIDDVQGVEPPEVVRYVLRRRVSRLGAGAYQLLEAASIFSSTWDAKNLERVTGMEREQVVAALDAAVNQRIVQTLPGVETYRFVHDLVRDTLRADLTTQAKKRFHLLAAIACEECLPWRGAEGVREVAHHLYQALPEGDALNAVTWLMRAARSAEHAFDHQDAALLYRFALDATRFLAEPDRALQRQLHETLARVTGIHSTNE